MRCKGAYELLERSDGTRGELVEPRPHRSFQRGGEGLAPNCIGETVQLHDRLILRQVVLGVCRAIVVLEERDLYP